MAYVLHAVIAKIEALTSVGELVVVALGDGFGLAPLSDEAWEDADDPRIAALCAKASLIAPVALVEAEFFGGEGTQKATVWDATAIVLGPLVDDDAINEALHELGVEPSGSLDEFDTLDLGRYRATDDWLELPHLQGV